MAQIVSPFIKYCSTIGVVPSTYEQNLTYIECLNFLIKFLNDTVIPAFNENDAAFAALQADNTQFKEDMTTAFNTLTNFVDNYFENLDVQEEINNKLDEMAEDGTLTNLISGYVDPFIEEQNTTIATAISNQNETISTAINSQNTAIANQNTRLSLLDTKKYIFIGDSYCEGYTPDGNVESWAVKLKGKLGLTNDNCTIAYHGGYGFANESQSFASILDGLSADSAVTDIVVCGGYNDLGGSYNGISTGMGNFVNVARNKFPNAKIHVGFIGFSDNYTQRNNIRSVCRIYKAACTSYPEMSYLANVEYSLKNVYQVFASDGIHPNETGQEFIALNLKNALVSGSADASYGYLSMNITADSLWDGTNENLSSIGTSFDNGLTTVECTGSNMIIVKTSTGFNWSGNMTWKKIGTITDGHIVGNNFGSIIIPTHMVVSYMDNGTTKYKNVQGFVRFENKEMHACYFEASGTNYVTTNDVRAIQIGKFSGSFQSLFC